VGISSLDRSNEVIRGGEEFVSDSTRDARPFLAHYLRQIADARDASDPAGIHLLARWVENLPAGDPRMITIAATDALGYSDGSFEGGEEAAELVRTCAVGGDMLARETWLASFADAVRRHWT
jgi:hypothetical protein